MLRAALVGLGMLAAGAVAAQEARPVEARPAAGDMRDLLEAARATAKATRESVDYNRTVPDILTQILIKLDKLEDKLDKIETAVKGQRKR